MRQGLTAGCFLNLCIPSSKVACESQCINSGRLQKIPQNLRGTWGYWWGVGSAKAPFPADPELDRMLDYVREGDTLVVTKPDRLARSTADLLAIAKQLETERVTLRILSMNVDTATPTDKLMLTILGCIAAFERDLMLERQREGIAKAKAEGKYKGRAPTARAKGDEVKRLKAEGLTADAIAEKLGIGRASVFRILRDSVEA